MTTDFKPSVQCLAAAKKANVALYQLRRTMRSREPRVLVPLFKAFVRPHLEYAVQAWAPLLKHDKTTLEAPQRRFTRWFSAIRAKPYTERLQELGLFSLERRRKRGDLIQTYKLIRGVDDVDWRLIFKAAKDHGLRGHPWEIEKPRARLNIRASSFAHRVVNDWNKLPTQVVQAKTPTAFKHLVDGWLVCNFPGTNLTDRLAHEL